MKTARLTLVTCLLLAAGAALALRLRAGDDARSPRDPAPESGGDAAPAGPLLLPLAGPLRLTSGFGEYRAGHYHGGLDFSTGGVTGLPVLAPEAGWVWRVRVSGSGYGKAVYFRLDDGRLALFAHLERFHPRLEAAAAERQDRERAWEVDFHPPRGTIRFTRGDTLAWTGESGAGPPHLHAEIRVGDEAEIAVHPFAHGWALPDAEPPSLTRLRVAPAGPGALVNGGLDPVIIDLAATASIDVRGPVELHVETSDRVDRGNPMATYRLRAAYGGAPLADVVLGRVDWRWPAEVEWTFHEGLARARNERWMALGPPPATRQVVHSRVDGGAGPAFGFPEGTGELVLVATDFAGNAVERAVRVVGAAAGSPPAAGLHVRDALLRTHGSFLEIHLPAGTTLAARGPRGAALAFAGVERAVPGGVVSTLAAPRPKRQGLWTFTLTGAGGDRPLGRAVWIDPARDDGLEVDLGAATLEIPAGAFHAATWVVVDTAVAPAGSPALTPTSTLVRLEPYATPLREPIRVGFPVQDGEAGAGVGSFREGWSWEGGARREGRVIAELGNLERVARVLDREAPRVAWVEPAEGAVVSASARIVARADDAGSGVTWRTLTLTVDGAAVLAEWDPEAGRLAARLRGPLAPGAHVVELRAADRAGNSTVSTRRFIVR